MHGSGRRVSLYCSKSLALPSSCRHSFLGVNTLRCCRFPSAVFRPSKLFFPRAFWITQRESSLCLLSPLAVDLRANSPFRWYASTRTPSPMPTDSMHVDAQGPHPTEIRGQSGRQYRIERVVQDKGSLLGRVFLATYVVPKRPSTGF